MRCIIFHIIFFAAFCCNQPLFAHQVSQETLVLTQVEELCDLRFEEITPSTIAPFDCIEVENVEEIEDNEPLSDPSASVRSLKAAKFTLKNGFNACLKKILAYKTPFLQAIPRFILVCVFRI